MNAVYDASESSGSEFNPCRDGYTSTSSLEAPLVPANRQSPHVQAKRKKTRAGAVPMRSTPKPFSFTDNEDDLGTPVLRRKREFTSVSQVELTTRMAAIEATLLKTVDDLKKKNLELTRTTTKQQQLIADLTHRVTVLERRGPKEVSKTAPKVSNGVKHAVRVAVAECNQHKGLALDLDANINSTNNRAIATYCWNYARTVVPEMTSDEFKVALDRYHSSKKEEQSRSRRGKLQAHLDAQRKNQRKRRKSSNRVEGIEVADIPQHVKSKYRKALSQRELMSTEESEIDEDGQRIFVTKHREWETAELTSAKRTADTAYNRKSGPAPAAKTRRTRGVSEARVPTVSETNRWTVTDFGLV